jgi:hypothetical protein
VIVRGTPGQLSAAPAVPPALARRRTRDRAAGTALLGLWAASVGAALVALCPLIVAAALGLCARHWLARSPESGRGPL